MRRTPGMSVLFLGRDAMSVRKPEGGLGGESGSRHGDGMFPVFLFPAVSITDQVKPEVTE